MTTDESPVLFDYPNPRSNAFIIMRFRETPQNQEILANVRQALDYYGIYGLRADDKSYADSLWSNVKSYMDACSLGIAIFEQIDDDDFNPNVSLELGYMMAHKKPVLLLKEKRLRALPADVVDQLYKTFDSYNIHASIRPSIHEWLRDIGIAKSSAERLLLFVSDGGTCRCAMAKVALDQSLSMRHLPFRLRVMSIAHAFGGTNEASRGARRAVYEAYGSDFLANHRVTHQNPGILEDADLILVMEDRLRNGLPAEKTFNFNEFFGLSDDVPDPWPDDDDDAAHKRYRDCLHHLRSVIEDGFDKILKDID